MPTNLQPVSETSAIILSSTGTAGDVAASVPFGVYSDSVYFLTGAAKQVDFVYKRLGGDVVDIELTNANVYAAYEEAVLEYSYILNMHQGKNILSDALGKTTGTFDHNGDSITGPNSANLQYSKITLSYANKVGDAVSTMAGFGGTTPIYSASFTTVKNQQDYDLQSIISSSSASGVDDDGNAVPYTGKVGDSRVIIDRVFYRSPIAMWRFYGYYGGMGVVGNYSTYGQYADDSTFEVVPTWQNKLQAIMYEDSLYTRTSHYSYEIFDNKLRLYPTPRGDDNFAGYLDRVWVRFRVVDNSWGEDDSTNTGVEGVNNINTLPFDNIPFENINSMGKQWIRNYALALCKEMLGQIRGKFQTVPIPGESVTLNYSALLSEAQKEKDDLRQKLSDMLKEIEYTELAKKDQEKVTAAEETLRRSPLPIFVGQAMKLIIESWNRYLSEPKTGFYGTTTPFDSFDISRPTEFGYHFGLDPEQSKHRIGNKGIVYKVSLDYSSPLKMRDVLRWDLGNVLGELGENRETISNLDREATKRARKNFSSRRMEQNLILADYLTKAGYDAIEYSNLGETGGKAVILWNPLKMKIVGEI